MNETFGSRHGGSCLLVLIIIALVGVLAVVVSRLVSVESERDEERRTEEVPVTEKTPEQLRRERINAILSDGASGLGTDPSTELVDGNIRTMKAVRDKTKKQHAVIKSRMKNAEESLARFRGEQLQLERKLKKLKGEFEKYPDEENVGDDLAQCDEDLENKRREILQAQADVKLLKDYDYRMDREIAVLSSAIRRCEADGRTIATATEYKALKRDLETAHGASVAIGEMRRGMDGETMGVSAGVAGEKARKRRRLDKYRKRKPEAAK